MNGERFGEFDNAVSLANNREREREREREIKV